MVNSKESQQPLVSVVIPCFNAERWIAEAIESVLSQTYSRIEIIVVNDGSTDNSRKVIESFGVGLTLIDTINQGGNHARNLGFGHSIGEYVQFLDADDLIEPDKIRIQVDALLSSNADVAYGNWRYMVHEHGCRTLGELVSPEMGPDNLSSLISDFWCPLFGYLFSREIVRRSGGWDLSAQAIQDVRFMIDVVLAGARLTKVDTLTGYYRRYGNVTVSTRSAYRFNEGCYNNALKLEGHWRSNGQLDDRQRAALNLVYGQVSRYFFQHDRTRFEEVYGRLRDLNRRYIPSHPLHLKVASFLFGYRNAEYLAKVYRSGKHLFGAGR